MVEKKQVAGDLMYKTNDYSFSLLAFQPVLFLKQSDLCEGQPETLANTSTPTRRAGSGF